MMKMNYSPGKKFLFCLLAGILVSGAIFNGYSQSTLLGDVNGDGIVSILDALRIAQYSAGMQPTGFNLSVGDTNCDNAVNIVDALRVAQYSAGYFSNLTCSSTFVPTVTPTITVTPTPTPTVTLPTCTPCPFVIEGYVKNSLTAEAIPGIAVTLNIIDTYYNLTAGTATDGHYRLSAGTCLGSGRAQVYVSKSGYEYYSVNTTLTCAGHNYVDINLVPRTPTPTPSNPPTPTPTPTCSPCVAHAQGYITDDVTNEPIPNATITGGTITGKTNAVGYYQTNTVSSCGGSESFTFTISAPGYQTLTLTKSVPCSTSFNTNFCITRIAVSAPVWTPAP